MTEYYKFLDLNRGVIESRYGRRKAWTVGRWRWVKGRVLACHNGFHASAEPLDALKYIQYGRVVAVVEARGDSDNCQRDKVCFRSMRIKQAYRWTVEDDRDLAEFASDLIAAAIGSPRTDLYRKADARKWPGATIQHARRQQPDITDAMNQWIKDRIPTLKPIQ